MWWRARLTAMRYQGSGKDKSSAFNRVRRKAAVGLGIASISRYSKHVMNNAPGMAREIRKQTKD